MMVLGEMHFTLLDKKMTSLNINTINKISNNISQSYGEYNTVIESGPLGGETIINLQPYFKSLYTIELSEHYFNYFNQVKIENEYTNVINYFGDTAQVLPEILKNLTSENKVIFWLDGHYSGGITARGESDCPIFKELEAIFTTKEKYVIITSKNRYKVILEMKYFFSNLMLSLFEMSFKALLLRDVFCKSTYKCFFNDFRLFIFSKKLFSSTSTPLK